MTKTTTSTKNGTEAKQRKRLPVLKRAPSDERPGIHTTPRDENICLTLANYRGLTTDQIKTLLFSQVSRSQCTLRLKLLFQHEFLQRTEQQIAGKHELVHWLNERGAALVATRRGIDVSEVEWEPKPQKYRDQFLDHLLATNDIRIHIELSVQQHGFTLEEWRDDKQLKKDHANDKVTITGPLGATQQVAIIPDGYGVILDPHQTPTRVYRFFLETDRATETGKSKKQEYRTFMKKVQAYLAYFVSDMYKQRYNTEAGKGRVLTVTTGEKRLANLKAVTEAQHGKSRFWFTTFDRIENNDILTMPVWSIAAKDGRYSLIEPVI